MTEEKSEPEVKAKEETSKQKKQQAEIKPKLKEKAKQKEKFKVELNTNCLNCNKPIKRIKRYYRDGKFYCNKQCWKDFIKKKNE